MMTYETIERLYKLAERVVAKTDIKGPRFSESLPHQYVEGFPQNIIATITEGRLRGQKFACYLAITKEMYEDPRFRELVIARCKETWRRTAISQLVPMTWLHGPKGKLPQ